MLNRFLRENFSTHYKSEIISNIQKPRLEYIDLAKGLCIILVVILHHNIKAFDLYGLSILRMPLYYFLSGLFFKHYANFGVFTKKKVNNLLIPYIFFELCYIAPKFITGVISYEQILPLLFNVEITNYPLWFLLSLFIINNIYYWIAKIDKEWLKLLSIFLCICIGYKMSMNDMDDYFISCSLLGIPFFYLGHCFNRKGLLYFIHNLQSSSSVMIKRLAILLPFISFFIIIIVYQCYDLPIIYYLQNDIQGNLLIFYFFSSLSVISFIGMGSAIKWLPIISYCGKYSIIILGLHIMFLGQKTTPIYWITGLIPTLQQLFPITLFLCWISIPVFKKYFPYFTA